MRAGKVNLLIGYLREYRKEGDTSPYRAVVANDFSTRKERDKAQGSRATGKAAGYGAADVDPVPDY